MKTVSTINIVEREDRSLQLSLPNHKPQTGAGLFLVSLTRHDIHTRDGIKLNDITMTAYVIAESAEGAVDQALASIYEGDWVRANEARQENRVEGTATRIPVLVRGWGQKAF